MKQTPQQLSDQIIKLLGELTFMAGGAQASTTATPKSTKNSSGATGGIRLLIEEGKLNTPKHLVEVIALLKDEGRHYLKQTIAMALLSLVRERVLTRLKGPGGKAWTYAVRR